MANYSFMAAGVIALVVTALLGFFIIPLLRKLSFGQTISDIGPSWHKNKQGTPLMGGFMFIIGSSVALMCALPMLGTAIVDSTPNSSYVLYVGIICTFFFAAIGFVDDYLKAIRKKNEGLGEWQKLAMQALVAAAFLYSLHNLGALSTWVNLPFFGLVDFGIVFYPLAFLLIVGMVNAVNFTDGVDGLCAGVTLVVMCAFFVLAGVLQRYQLSLAAAALAGGCMGFLIWNFYPARVFMGDTGSMFLGGAVVCMGFCLGHSELILILGVIYWVEALSVVIQRTYYKLTKGKRLFKMTPIHHGLEMSGWSEVKIVVVFSSISAVMGVLGYLYLHTL